ncbi:MAG TPA: 50S ribosomal protein L32 [Parachlamydiaceae bacterium]|nr:50S ribosomal protein L32 [Parachlamydiaceae bacterium]
MAVPRNRLSNSRKNTKRSHHAKKPKNVHVCSSCSKPKLRHTICQSCGSYAGRVVIAETV